MPIRNSREHSAFQVEKDSSAINIFHESSSPKMAKSPSLQRATGYHTFRSADASYNSHESPKIHSPPSELMENGMPLTSTDRAPSIKRQDSFEMRLPELPKIDVHSINRQASTTSDPESPISPLLTSDPKNERSHSKTFSRPIDHFDDMPARWRELKNLQHQKPPSFWRLAVLSFPEWLYALLGSFGAAIFGSFNPLLAYIIALIVAAYYNKYGSDTRHEVNKWSLIIACMGIITVVANFLQHFYFGIMGEKMTERVRRMMFSGNCLHFYHINSLIGPEFRALFCH